MKIDYIMAGAGSMVCGSCLRDGALIATLCAQGHDVQAIPVYTPARHEADDMTVQPIFMGGLNIWLQHKIGLFRYTPRWVDRWFDSPRLLNYISRFGGMTEARELAALTISTLRGAQGTQRKEVKRLLDWMRDQRRPDVVMLSNALLVGVGASIRQCLDVPVVSLLSGEDLFINDFPEPQRSEAIAALREQAARCDGFIAFNESYRNWMREYLEAPLEKIERLPLGIDLRGYPDSVPEAAQEFTVGFLARICPQKGLLELVRAFGSLCKEDTQPGARLRIAGYLGPEYRDYLDRVLAMARDGGYADCVEYVGELSRTEKIAFLKSVSVLCVPSVHGESKAQFIPEAMAAGAALVLPETGCFSEWVNASGGGILCPPDSEDALAAALRTLRDNRDLLTALRAAAHRTAHARHGIDAMAESLIGILERRIPL